MSNAKVVSIVDQGVRALRTDVGKDIARLDEAVKEIAQAVIDLRRRLGLQEGGPPRN